MNPSRHRILCALICGLIAVSSGIGQEPAQEIEIHFEWVQLDHRAATKLISEHGGKKNAAAFRKALDDEPGAEVIESVLLRVENGVRAKVESGEKVHYAAKFATSKPNAKDPEDKVVTPGTVTGLDSQDVGPGVEVESTIAEDGKAVAIKATAEIVRYLGDRKIGDPAADHTITMPAFYTMGISTAIRIVDGEVALVGLMTPPPKVAATGKRVLLFMGAKILR